MPRKRNFKPLGCTHIDGGTINPFGAEQQKRQLDAWVKELNLVPRESPRATAICREAVDAGLGRALSEALLDDAERVRRFS